ncbi:heterogeneous nuclear ribonucleoprotein 1-like [Chenopodium quinoa]|uniref:RRM domain-containing protein n=1 Tax=Chenopodium quinoa TaxID=63459 RepID=A0A803KT20_CHEQI|nr:heterogeneous nuclear ribonucleoprotein 1-like [Chenopodium quinoa]
MDSDQGKLFVGGISWETTEEKLKEYFGQYGDVFQANIMRDNATGRPRGFGFVLFSDPSVIDRVLQDKHTIDGRPVEAKRAMSREEQQNSGRAGSNNGGRSGGGGGNFRTKKIFVGGLPPTVTDEVFREYFENYGQVTDVVIMYDQNTRRPRGFGFISFDSEDAVDRVLQNTFHDLNGKQVEVKRALPKDANPGMGSRGSGGLNAFEGRMDSNRYMQPQNAGGAFPPYGSSGYGAAGYGYGPASGMGYGGYAGYGGGNPGYGGPASAAYGNPNLSNAQRSSWNAQAASAYGAAGYGSAGPWAASGAGSGVTGQSPGGASGYGYGNYGGSDGYGSVGNRAGGAPGSNASAGGEMQGGYGDANGHGGYGAGGYGAQVNGPLGAQMGYGGGYGGAR